MSMKIREVSLVVVICLTAVINQSAEDKPKKALAAQVITSTTDANGQPHPASLGISGSGTATCISATGGRSVPASCSINNQVVNVNNSIGVTKTVYLICNGQAPLKCSARVSQ